MALREKYAKTSLKKAQLPQCSGTMNLNIRQPGTETNS